MADILQTIADVLRQEFQQNIDVPQLCRGVLRLGIAAFLGSIVGWERERWHKAAGLRTHMLVAIGGALFMLAPHEMKMTSADLSRVIQGIVTGIGFLGAGAILKLSDQREIRGLTTAAGIWLTAGVGIATGLGRYSLALCAVVLAWFILRVLERFENHPRNEDIVIPHLGWVRSVPFDIKPKNLQTSIRLMTVQMCGCR